MTANLFTDLEHNVADLLRENERALARIRQLEDQLATCQADRDRARDAGERLAGIDNDILIAELEKRGYSVTYDREDYW